MAKKRTVFIVGNPLVRADSMPLRIMPRLQKMLPQIEFVLFEPTRMDIPLKKDIVFVDTVEGIRKVRVLDDIGKIEAFHACSLHDFDLGAQLLLLRKFDLLGKVRIVGVPAKGKVEKTATDVAAALQIPAKE